MCVTNDRHWVVVLLGLIVVAMTSASVVASDPENCLSCHKYRGLSRVEDDGSTVHLYHVDPNYYDRALGPHARVACTGCHPRDEVEVIPHKPVSPVNCAQVCHIVTPAEIETTFSHDHVAEMLESSVHTAEVLEACNEILGDQLRPGQSRCLLCHEEPTFRHKDEPWASTQTPVSRCGVCHETRLPAEVRFSYWHVHARSRQARTHENLAKLCGYCHSNEAIREAYDLTDSTATYLASFHGKAMLLGSEETAGCLDCHVRSAQNIHVMRAAEDAESAAHLDRLAYTCRSAQCHPRAGAELSSAAIHLNLATNRGMEFFIAALFVLLIVSTFGPSVLLQLLEFLQIVVGRHDPKHHEDLRKATELSAHPQGHMMLKRFTPHQRIQHWVLFLSFTALVITGFPIKFADRDWAAWIITELGGLPLTRLIHRWAGVLLLAGFAYHMVYLLIGLRDFKRASGKSWIRAFMDSPMMFNMHDLRELGHLLAYLLFLRSERPRAERFSLEEKFEYLGVFWGTIILGVTGVLMWANAWTTTYFPGEVLTAVSLIHSFEAFLALLHVGVVHMVGVILTPAVFPFSPVMVTGNTPPGELAEAHSAMLDRVEAELKDGSGEEVGHA